MHSQQNKIFCNTTRIKLQLSTDVYELHFKTDTHTRARIVGTKFRFLHFYVEHPAIENSDMRRQANVFWTKLFEF
jgi:hypothetical protein